MFYMQIDVERHLNCIFFIRVRCDDIIYIGIKL